MQDDGSLPEATTTVRQRLMRWLEQREFGFEELRATLQLSVRRLEEELRHVDRTARGQGKQLRIAPPRCEDCGYAFPGRGKRHLHTPGRCPRCRGERIEPPRFRIAA